MSTDEALQPTGAEQQPEDPDAPACKGKPEHADWETWWLRFGIQEAYERTPRLHGNLRELRNTTYVALALVAMIHTASASAGLVVPHLVVAPYVIGALGVFASLLWAHRPVSIGVAALLEDAAEYKTAKHAKHYLEYTKKIYDDGTKQLRRRTRGVEIALVCVLVQAAGAGLLLLRKGITPP